MKDQTLLIKSFPIVEGEKKEIHKKQESRDHMHHETIKNMYCSTTSKLKNVT